MSQALVIDSQEELCKLRLQGWGTRQKNKNERHSIKKERPCQRSGGLQEPWSGGDLNRLIWLEQKLRVQISLYLGAYRSENCNFFPYGLWGHRNKKIQPPSV